MIKFKQLRLSIPFGSFCEEALLLVHDHTGRANWFAAHTGGPCVAASLSLSLSPTIISLVLHFLFRFCLLDVPTSRPSVTILTLVYAYVQTKALFHRDSPALASRYNRSIDPEAEMLRYAKQILLTPVHHCCPTECCLQIFTTLN
jgi:hypothetical protein